MGSSSKRTKEKESRKRRHRSRSESPEREREVPKEKRHRHHRRHHKDKKRERHVRHEYDSADSDVVEVISPVSTPPPPVIDRQSSPDLEATGGSSECLSIEDTNRLRAKLGLKPLQVEHKSKSEEGKRDDGKKKDDWGEFYHKPAHSLTEKNAQEKLRGKLAVHKERRHVEQKLSKVKLLGEVISEDDDDAAAWVKKIRKSEDAKKEADKRAKMLEELDAQFGIGEVIESEQREKRNKQYTDKNLKGLEVEHDVDSFKEGYTVILTLKDQEVLDEGGDVLMNVNLKDNERYQKNVQNKKKKSVYDTSYEDVGEQYDEFGMLKAKTLLKKYDEEIDGQKKESFKIGYLNLAERKAAALQSIRDKLSNKLVDTLVTPELSIASDYYNEEELARFKKPKKKPKKMRSKGKILTADDLEQVVEAQNSTRTRSEPDHLNFDDIPETAIDTKVKLEEEHDDMLERALHKARKLKQRETRMEAFTSIDVKEEAPEEPVDPGSITLNSTAEFCRTLGDIPTYGKSGNREESENLLDYEKEQPEEPMEEDEEPDEGGKWNAVDPNRVIKQPIPEVVVETPILDEEPDVSSGVGAALKLAMSKGYLDKEVKNRPSNSRLAHLQAQHYSIEDKSHGEEFERGNRRERYTGPIMDFKDKDLYKPNVKLEYIDDEGHVLNAKEAFRYLSHKFHGKGPGKNKVEKRLKKTVQEGLMKKMSSTDTPLGTLNMLQSKQKEMQTPYIVLSGGKHTHSTTIAKARR